MEFLGSIRIKWSYVTHRVDRSLALGLVPVSHEPDPGRVVLARVISIGKHKDIEGVNGRKMALFPGDVIAGALGHRYATDQFEGYAAASGPTGHLLGQGGVCGEVRSKNEKMVDPTCIEWVGCLKDPDGQLLHLRRCSLHSRYELIPAQARMLLVVGGTMNSGKTTVAAQAIRSLSGQGRRVAAAKITGTACRKDLGIMEDAGAVRVLDFTDCGHPSTAHCSREEVLKIAFELRQALLEEQPEFIVLEIADGIFQRETRFLLEDCGFRETIDAVIFAGLDSASCESGVRRLREQKYNIVAVAGLVANSRLGMAEVAAATGVPCLNGQMILGGALDCALQAVSAA